MSKFQLGQIVKQNRGLIAHYAIVIAENRTIGWVNDSTLEVKAVEQEHWQPVKLARSHSVLKDTPSDKETSLGSLVQIRGEAFEFEQIKRNIKSFKDALEQGKARKYSPSEFNCEHWATLMVTGKSYSTQSGAVKFGTAEIVGGAMIGIGASAGTVVTIVSSLGVAASTGTAISSLSGAAATNAALAWLGGGTLAAGGGGVAAGTAIVSAVATGGAVVAIAGVGIIGKKVWDNLDESQRQAIIDKIDNSTPEQVKVAYGITTEKATEILGITANWIGKSTVETAKYIETVAKSKEVKTALDKTTEIGLMAGTMAVDGAILAGEEAVKQISNISNKVSSWWQNC